MLPDLTPIILEKHQLSADVFMIKVNAPLIAQERKAGQFILLSVDETYGERIPLTIADGNAEEGWIRLIFQRIGKTTTLLADLPVGSKLGALAGPLGQPTHIEKFGHCVCVGGGIGVAPLHPIVQALKEAGNKITMIIGARSKELVILEKEMRELADDVIICTDDGSYGRKDLVTAPLKELCEQTEKPDLVIAAGPPIMMKFCAATTRPYQVPTVVSLNTIMIDGTGMCGGCRIKVGGETKFVCVDGPEFDGHQVDFDNMMKRLGAYKPQEHEALQNHKCRIGMH